MTWRTWCYVMLVTAVVATTSVGAWQDRQYSARRDRILFSAYTPSQYHVARVERAAEQTTKDVEDGKDKNGINTVEEEKGGAASGEDLLPKSDECGLRSRKSYRILFGEDAPLSAFPWMALLGFHNVSNPSWLCGGALINDRYVVTAAHCVHPTFTKKSSVGQLVSVRLGEHNLDTDPDCPDFSTKPEACAPSPQDFSPEQVIIHEDYSTRIVTHDIALIRLDKPVTMSRSIQPVCFPPAGLNIEEFLESRDAVVAGWGATQNAARSEILQRASIPLASREKCAKIYLLKLSEGQVCFGGRGKVDSCCGDSGGPIMQAKKGSPRYTMLGIVSFGKRVCGIPGTPAVYTNVPYYRDWVVKNLKP